MPTLIFCSSSWISASTPYRLPSTTFIIHWPEPLKWGERLVVPMVTLYINEAIQQNSISKHKWNTKFIQVLVPRRPATLHPATVSLALYLRGGNGILDPRHHGLWLPPEIGVYWIPSSRETDPTHLRNREPDIWSGLLDPPCIDADGKGKGKLPGVPHARACTTIPLLLCLGPGYWDPIHLDHSSGNQSHQG